MATDRLFVASRYTAETSGLPNLTPPLEHSEETLAAIPDGSLDVIWLTAEPEYDFLLLFLPDRGEEGVAILVGGAVVLDGLSDARVVSLTAATTAGNENADREAAPSHTGAAALPKRCPPSAGV